MFFDSEKKCSECNETFDSQFALNRHLTANHKHLVQHKNSLCDSSFVTLWYLKKHECIDPADCPSKCSKKKCNECNETFDSQIDLNRHLTVNHKHLVPYQCSLCDRSFVRLWCLKKHERIHSTDWPSRYSEKKCSECNETFDSQFSLSRHLTANHKHLVPYQCSLCDSSFAKLKYLKRHELRHSTERPCKCSFCDLSFKCATALKSHERLHNGEKPYTCQVCGESFIRRFALRRHSVVHSKEQFKCKDCPKVFLMQASLKKHAKYHSGDLPILGCEHCGKTFRKKSCLNCHVQTHNPDKPYLCQDCGKRFGTAQRLRMHIYQCHSAFTSKTQKPFRCADCNRSFHSKNVLIDHMNRHSGVKPYTCESCGKSFTRGANLKQHVVIHSSVKPFKCNLCDRAFSWKSHLTAHIRTHSGAMPHQCEHCDKCFSQRSGLRLHMKAAHDVELPYTSGKVSVVGSNQDEPIVVKKEIP